MTSILSPAECRSLRLGHVVVFCQGKWDVFAWTNSSEPGPFPWSQGSQCLNWLGSVRPAAGPGSLWSQCASVCVAAGLSGLAAYSTAHLHTHNLRTARALLERDESGRCAAWFVQCEKLSVVQRHISCILTLINTQCLSLSGFLHLCRIKKKIGMSKTCSTTW